MTTIASDAGLTRPAIAVEAGSRAPMSTTETTSTTSKPSRTGTSDPTRYVSGLGAKRSHTTSTIVAVAIPPIRFPAAKPRWPDSAAEIVTASSGRLPAMASSTIPPIASPSPSRLSSSSVDVDSFTPAPQVTADATRKMKRTTYTESEVTAKSLPIGQTQAGL